MLAIQILLVAGVVWFVVRAIRNGASASSMRGAPCASCRHCGSLFDDGVLCQFGRAETFKNEVHIANCHDYRRRA